MLHYIVVLYFWDYTEKIMVDLKPEDVKIVVIAKTSFREYILKSNSNWEMVVLV